MANKIDSNVTGLRFCEEATPKVLPGSPVWYPLEPNSFQDFGGQLKLLSRSPISQSRQRKKGVITDLDASGGFTQDLTQNNSTRLLQGVVFADAREKGTTAKMNSAAIAVTAVDGTGETYAVDNDPSLGFLVNHLVLASAFGVATNNGLKKLSAVSTTLLTTTGLDDETPPAAAKIEIVGYEFATSTLDVTTSGGLARLNRASGVFDFTTLNLVPGEFIYVGGDTAGTRFDNNQGWARVNAVAAGYIELDKTSWTHADETGTGKTVRIFFGTVFKNESNPALVKTRTYQFERTVGTDGAGTMSEYLTGSQINEMTVNVKQADKVTIDFGIVSSDNEQRTGTDGVKAGDRPSLTAMDCFNTSSDMGRIKLALVSASNPAPTTLFAYATELQITVKNNVSPNKAIGVLGAFDTTAGMFEVGGKLTAYFADITAVQAVRNNSDVTIDMILAKANAGIAFDLPLISLGDGRLNIEQDQAITLPLEMNAAESKFNHTLLISVFPYLPTAAC